MNQKKTLTIVLFFVLMSNMLFAKEGASCLETAMTQAEMNECSGMSYQIADGELNRIYDAIQSRYAEDKLFLKKLKTAQLAWIKLRDADFEMQFPHANDSQYYGSIFPTCASAYKTDLTLQRVAFLKQWLIGVEEGDSCAGSKQRAMTATNVAQAEEENEIETLCYANVMPYQNGEKLQDVLELMLSINHGNGTVKGEYNYLPAEKDKRWGEIDGSFWKGAISAKYSFEQEGQRETTDLRIHLKENAAVVEEVGKKSSGVSDTIKQISCK